MMTALAARLTIVALALGAAAIAAAEAVAQDALIRQREAAVMMTKGNPAAAVDIYTEALRDPALQNERRAMIVNDRGVAHAQLGHTKLAIEDFNRAVQLFPEHAPIYNNRGSLLLNVGMTSEALKDFDRAIVLAPTLAAAFNNRAAVHLKMQQAPAAVADYTRAIELLPAAQSAAPLVGRGRAYMAQNLPHAAIRDFSRAVNADARFAAGYRSRAEAKTIIARPEDAIEDLSRAVAFDPSNAELYVLRGQAYLANRNAVAAVKDFQKAIELAPNLLVAHQSMALAHAEAAAFEEALADLSRALELDPRSGVSYAYRAWVYKRAQQVEIGAKDLQTAIRLAPDTPEVLWVKGEFAADQGRAQEAIGDLRRALKAKPELKAAENALASLGADVSEAAEVEAAHLAIDAWRVIAQGDRYVAVLERNNKVRVPLEMMGSGEPRLLEWDVKDGEFKGIGTLRFHGGIVQGKSGPEPLEQVAIVDLTAASVVAIEPHRLGATIAEWTWNEGKVVVASVDGVRDEFVLRRPAPKREQVAATTQRRATRRSDGPDWAPWNNNGYSERSRRSYSKPKSFFDLLFGN